MMIAMAAVIVLISGIILSVIVLSENSVNLLRT